MGCGFSKSPSTEVYHPSSRVAPATEVLDQKSSVNHQSVTPTKKLSSEVLNEQEVAHTVPAAPSEIKEGTQLKNPVAIAEEIKQHLKPEARQEEVNESQAAKSNPLLSSIELSTSAAKPKADQDRPFSPVLSATKQASPASPGPPKSPKIGKELSVNTPSKLTKPIEHTDAANIGRSSGSWPEHKAKLAEGIYHTKETEEARRSSQVVVGIHTAGLEAMETGDGGDQARKSTLGKDVPATNIQFEVPEAFKDRQSLVPVGFPKISALEPIGPAGEFDQFDNIITLTDEHSEDLSATSKLVCIGE